MKVKNEHGDYNLVQMAYFELVKNRDSISDVTIPLVNKLHLFDFEEMDRTVFKKMHEQFKDDGEIPIYNPNYQTNLYQN